MAQAGIRYARKWNKKSVLYCLDLWPASLSAGGIKGGLIYKWFHRKSKKIYRAVDKILITSKSFADYFEKEFGISETTYLPQYAEDTFSPDKCRKEPDEFIDLMFAGNIGAAQSVDTIIKAAALCKDVKKLRWHIVGDGKELDSMKGAGCPGNFPWQKAHGGYAKVLCNGRCHARYYGERPGSQPDSSWKSAELYGGR